MQWQQMLVKYLSSIKVAFQYEDFDDEEIALFQDYIDELVGLSSITNCIHLLGVGHQCLKECLNFQSQPAIRIGMKKCDFAAFVHRHTRQGGAGGSLTYFMYCSCHAVVPCGTDWTVEEALVFFSRN